MLVTGYDILFFWVARMMMFGLYAMADRGPADSVPFRAVALHGLVRDSHGKKMSKSRGNTVDPLDWIDRFGADATRFTLARGATPGSDVAVSEEWAAGARNFCNKLWNATRFALLNGAVTDDRPRTRRGLRSLGAGRLAEPSRAAGPSRLAELAASSELSVPDRWILSRLGAVTAEADGLFERFEFGKACDALYHFAWDEFCDWYLELAKASLTGDDPAAADATRLVLGTVLDRLLRLLHPVIPFVTDELWTALTGGDTVMIAPWPGSRVEGQPSGSSGPAVGSSGPGGGYSDPGGGYSDPAAEAEIAALMRLVTQVRRFRSDQGLRPTQPVPADLAGIETTPLASHEARIRSLLRLTAPADGFTATATVQAEGVTVRLDTAAGIDLGAERRRLEKDLAAARGDVDAAQRKLSSPAFIERAPEAIVAKNRDRLAAAEAEIARLEDRLAALPPPD